MGKVYKHDIGERLLEGSIKIPTRLSIYKEELYQCPFEKTEICHGLEEGKNERARKRTSNYNISLFNSTKIRCYKFRFIKLIWLFIDKILKPSLMFNLFFFLIWVSIFPIQSSIDIRIRKNLLLAGIVRKLNK